MTASSTENIAKADIKLTLKDWSAIDASNYRKYLYFFGAFIFELNYGILPEGTLLAYIKQRKYDGKYLFLRRLMFTIKDRLEAIKNKRVECLNVNNSAELHMQLLSCEIEIVIGRLKAGTEKFISSLYPHC